MLSITYIFIWNAAYINIQPFWTKPSPMECPNQADDQMDGRERIIVLKLSAGIELGKTILLENSIHTIK